jgi:hypothetical protein
MIVFNNNMNNKKEKGYCKHCGGKLAEMEILNGYIDCCLKCEDLLFDAWVEQAEEKMRELNEEEEEKIIDL